MTPHVELQLVRQCLAGCVDSYRSLVEHYHSLAYSVGLAATGNSATSEDIVQESFTLAWNRLSELRDLRRFRPWLCGIVRNQARTIRRHEQRHAPDAGKAWRGLCEHACGDATPLEHTIAQQEREILASSLAALAEADRAPLVLRYGEQMTTHEIADVLNISEAAVRQRLSRARRRLRNRVEEIERLGANLRASKKGAAIAIVAVVAPAAATATTVSASLVGPVALKCSAGLVAATLAAFIGLDTLERPKPVAAPVDLLSETPSSAIRSPVGLSYEPARLISKKAARAANAPDQPSRAPRTIAVKHGPAVLLHPPITRSGISFAPRSVSRRESTNHGASRTEKNDRTWLPPSPARASLLNFEFD